MRLIIAEKHSVGQAIAQAVGGHAEKHDGYIQVGGDLVTWAQGHLVDLAAPDEYKNHDWGKWSLDTLPIDPTPDWQWKVSRDKGADRQYKVVAGLMRRGDIDMLVDACDPDREGEAIFRRIVAHVGVSKPMRRLWVASLEEDAIRGALASMKDETEYQGLADSAMIRAKADWLIGMNASRAYSLVYNARFTVGRVQTPTLAMIVDRDRQIAGHVARPYWKVVAPMGGWKLTGERLDKGENAETLLRIVNSDDFAFQILKAERKQQHDAPPSLYDLTGLQKDMSRLHGLTAARTLTALQSLYEKRLTTYPRTDSRYITHDDLDTLRGLAEGDRLVTGFIEPSAKPERPRLELTVNDAKVAGHTAILPTMQADRAALDELGDDERLVLTRVARRMWEAVGDDYVHDVTNVVASTRIGAKSIRTKAAFCPKANVASPAVPTSPSRPDGTPSSMPPRRKTRMTPTRPRATSSLSTSPTGSSSRRSRRTVRHCPRERRSRRSRSPRRRCSPRWSTPAAGWRTRNSRPPWMTTNPTREASARPPPGRTSSNSSSTPDTWTARASSFAPPNRDDP